MCSPAIQPSTTPSRRQREGALFRKVSRNQPASPAHSYARPGLSPSVTYDYICLFSGQTSCARLRSRRAANQAGARAPHPLPASARCRLGTGVSLDASQLTGSGTADGDGETLDSNGPVRQCAHSGEAGQNCQLGPFRGHELNQRQNDGVRCGLPRSWDGRWATGEGGTVEGGGEQEGEMWEPDKRAEFRPDNTTAPMTTGAGLQWRTVSPGPVHTDAAFLLGPTDIAPHSPDG